LRFANTFSGNPQAHFSFLHAMVLSFMLVYPQLWACQLAHRRAMASPDIIALIDQCGHEDAKIVLLVDRILDLLIVHKLAYRSRLSPQRVGIHPCNRDGVGISEHDMHRLGQEIVGMGWSWSACAHAVCVEDHGKVIEQFTHAMMDGRAEFGQSPPGVIEFGSVSCSKTNQFLCAVNGGAPQSTRSSVMAT
jgi:hypothetical protein